jgi:hypothetical protein
MEKMMPSLDELMSGKVPGSVKVRKEKWPMKDWFIPYFRVSGFWHGLSEDEKATAYEGGDNTWQIYTAPKPKKTVYEWMYIPNGKSTWQIFRELLTETEAEYELQSCVEMRKTGRSFEIEVEE